VSWLFWRLRARTRIVAVAAAILAAGATVPSAQAAGNGSLGASTAGTIDLNIVVPNLVQISMLNDVNLGAWSGSNMTAFEQFCTFSSTRSYRVTASSAHGVGNRFYMENAGTTLRYVVRWYDSNNFSRNLRNNQASATFSSNATAVDCGGITNSRVRIRVRNNWAAATPAGTYTDTLTLVIEPM